MGLRDRGFGKTGEHRWRRSLAGLSIALLACGGSLALGFTAGRGQRSSDSLLATATDLARRLFGRARHNRSSPQTSTAIATGLLTLTRTVSHLTGADVDTTAANLVGDGGGVTSFGSDVLVLPFDGRIRAVNGAGVVRPTTIVAPSTNRSVLVAAEATLTAKGFVVSPQFMRYSDILYVEGGGSRGLLVSFTEYHPGPQCFTNTLARLPISSQARTVDDIAAGPSDWSIVHRTSPCLPLHRRRSTNPGNSTGGRLTFVPPATALWTSGDFAWDGLQIQDRLLAQDPVAEYGKVLAVDLRSHATRIISRGHRNPQGIAVSAAGHVFVTEHGPRGGDELNRIRAGANFGWPFASYGIQYNGLPLPWKSGLGRHEGFTPPVYAWLPSVGISALIQIRGFDAAWDGDLLVGSLAGNTLYRLRLENERVVYAEAIPVGARVRAIHQPDDGRIVLWTDNGDLISLTHANGHPGDSVVGRYLRDLPSDIREPTAAAIGRCRACHLLTSNAPASGPGLLQVYGDRIASSKFTYYSRGLREIRGTWTTESLLEFLESPERFAPGSTMPNPGLSDPRVRRAIVDLLDHLDRGR
jgi:cytochrome c2